MSTASGYRIIAAIAVVLALSGCDISVDGDGSTKVNGSVHIQAGKAGRRCQNRQRLDSRRRQRRGHLGRDRQWQCSSGSPRHCNSAKTVNGAMLRSAKARTSAAARVL